jgi:hypothetical protein
MAKFGWAYINCTEDTDYSGGPSGSIQFMAGDVSGSTTGSGFFTFYTASAYGHHENHLILSGNMTITGALSASVIHYTDVSRIDATGSTFFGNSYDDIHRRTGSLEVYGRNIWDGVTQLESILSASAYSGQVKVGGFGGRYRNVTSSHYTASTHEYILGIATPFTGGTDPVRLTIPTASMFGSGGMLIVKDEVSNRGGSSIVLTRSVTDTNTIDGAAYYTLTGTLPAISLYSNGSNWFVF